MKNGLVYVNKYFILEHEFGKKQLFIPVHTKFKRR